MASSVGSSLRWLFSPFTFAMDAVIMSKHLSLSALKRTPGIAYTIDPAYESEVRDYLGVWLCCHCSLKSAADEDLQTTGRRFELLTQLAVSFA